MLSGIQKQRILSGMDYENYTRQIISLTESVQTSDSHKYEKLKLNSARSRRLDKTFLVSEHIKEVFTGVTSKQVWMILSEAWCGDSAQNIPVIAKLASQNSFIELRILLRDENSDIMDLFLSNGTRSIPVLVAFDEEWNEIFKWGPRPKAAKDMVNDLKVAGLPKDEINEKLHKWYALNKGEAVSEEICEILRTELTSELL
jgi:hypothetical protein